MNPKERLRYHVTGAIERGEATAIVEQRAPYNGHADWDHWNVAVWLGNDEPLYRLAVDAKRRAHDDREAAEGILSALESLGMRKTPDGAAYTIENIQAAISDF